MSPLLHIPIFSFIGRRESPISWFFTTVGILLFTTLFMLSILVPDKLQGCWIWMLLLIASLGCAVYLFRKDRVAVEILKANRGELLLCIKGLNLALEFTFDAQKIKYWYTFHYVSNGIGKPARVIYYCVISGDNNKRIIFREMAGVEGSEPADWECHDDRDSDGEGVFMIQRIPELVRVIESQSC